MRPSTALKILLCLLICNYFSRNLKLFEVVVSKGLDKEHNIFCKAEARRLSCSATSEECRKLGDTLENIFGATNTIHTSAAETNARACVNQ